MRIRAITAGPIAAIGIVLVGTADCAQALDQRSAKARALRAFVFSARDPEKWIPVFR
jgi:hypothetical protein